LWSGLSLEDPVEVLKDFYRVFCVLFLGLWTRMVRTSTPLFVKPPSIQNQAQYIVDGMIDRMYFLVEQGRTDCAVALHKEIEEWTSLESNQDIDVLSIEIN
jgi:hypothetical protein